jgi:hypothetical protein
MCSVMCWGVNKLPRLDVWRSRKGRRGRGEVGHGRGPQSPALSGTAPRHFPICLSDGPCFSANRCRCCGALPLPMTPADSTAVDRWPASFVVCHCGVLLHQCHRPGPPPWSTAMVRHGCHAPRLPGESRWVAPSQFTSPSDNASALEIRTGAGTDAGTYR